VSEHYFIGGPLDGQWQAVPEDEFLPEVAAAEVFFELGISMLSDLNANAVPVSGLKQRKFRYLRRLAKRPIDGKEVAIYVLEGVIPTQRDMHAVFWNVPIEIPERDDFPPITRRRVFPEEEGLK
jgi:hypothetical protein